MQTAYSDLEQTQPAGHRFHKGFPLHQLGLWALEKQDPAAARRLFLEAFVEDVLSRGEESPAQWDELGRPAAQVLIFTFSIAGPLLIDLARRLRIAQASGVLCQTPEAALGVNPLSTTPPQGPEAEAARLVEEPAEPFAPEWRQLGDFGTLVERRVFIGGSYAHRYLEPAMRAARDQARACGWDGVLVAEFRSPLPINNRTKSLICLMGCRRAIFELSESGGHQVEFDKLVDFGIDDVLVVYNAEVNDRLKISSLTKAWFSALHVKESGYRGIPDLRRIVADWLGCGDSEPGSANDLARRATELATGLGTVVGSVVDEHVRRFLASELQRSSRRKDE